jgi:hypothetical protein
MATNQTRKYVYMQFYKGTPGSREMGMLDTNYGIVLVGYWTLHQDDLHT